MKSERWSRAIAIAATEALEADVGRAYNELFFERGEGLMRIGNTIRTSMIADPADGRIPALTTEAQKRLQAARNEARMHPADGPEDRSLTERCLFWATTGPPMLPGPYNNTYQIYQTPGSVMILSEMIHEARIIPHGWPSACAGGDPQMDGRLNRSLGRRHAGGRYHELHRQNAVSRIGREPARDRALHAHRCRTRFCIDSPSTIRRRSRSLGPRNFRCERRRVRSTNTPVTKGTTRWWTS